jgi:hypothetical protein
VPETWDYFGQKGLVPTFTAYSPRAKEGVAIRVQTFDRWRPEESVIIILYTVKKSCVNVFEKSAKQ